MNLKKWIALSISMILLGTLNQACSDHTAASTSSGTSASATVSDSASAPDPSATLDSSTTPEPTATLAASPTPEPTPTPVPTLTPKPTPKPIILQGSAMVIGDYLQMGRYYNEPILWRCVDIDENGPLMLADRILTIKAFDAAGINLYLDGTVQPDNSVGSRTTYGSNLWETSNLRSWLNSTAAAGNVIWLDGCPPTKDKLRNNLNEYAMEKGFLSTGNFTANEINLLKSVSQKSILGRYDQEKLKSGGTATLINLGGKPYFQKVTDVLQNYDTAYYHDVIDKMFILDIKQVNKVLGNEGVLGANYHVGKPTQKMIDNAEYKDPSFLSPEKFWYYWLRTPVADNSITSVLIQAFDGIYYDSANDFYIGVRPAFYMNPAAEILKYAKNSQANPYVVSK